ncbi:ARC6/PARC6 family protein [cf. Phormidesmis sp. LEGE 11477]|uniref:ARC6/PARC6 family protein n=1 Tax=cf. Phormidesmis sp. LEGE 11477 TaxID=1828680 RepID=UPI00187F4148|nr:ARC6/PARC6 family protein [cf. Phormidesmis sp. LEGE 11477]MBE9062697.1 DUF4101 domain-containing protein [cf. Phormidesmis sp. LEGE 11477]
MDRTSSHSAISFKVRLTEDDWETDFKRWRCSALRIPRVEVKRINFGGSGETVLGNHYTLDKIDGFIEWDDKRAGALPSSKDLAVLLRITEALSTKRDKDRWRNSAVAAAIIGAIATVLAAMINARSPLLYQIVSLLRPSDETPGNPLPPNEPAPSISPVREPEQPNLISPPDPLGSPVPDPILSKDSNVLEETEAIDLVEDWLEAKSRIFAPPFDKNLLATVVHTEGPLYKEIISSGKGIDSLKKSKSFYTFESFDLEFWGFSSSDNPLLKARVSETFNYHEPRKNPERINSTASNTYTFKEEDGNWKIYDYSDIDIDS